MSTPFSVDSLVAFGTGNVCVLLTSPHGGCEGIGEVPPRTKPGACHIEDSNTNQLLTTLRQYLNTKTNGMVIPYFVMGLAHRKYCDLNRPPDSAFEEPDAERYYNLYHEKIKQYLTQIKSSTTTTTVCPTDESGDICCLLLDIHGQSTLKDHTMRGTQNGKTVKHLIEKFGEEALLGENSLFGQLQKRGFNVYPGNEGIHKSEEHKEFNGGWTVCYYSGARRFLSSSSSSSWNSFDCFVDCVQMEIGFDFRKDNSAIQRFSEALGEAILAFGKKYLQFNC